ncbi:MAG: peptide deformylase [Saezia sp.]
MTVREVLRMGDARLLRVAEEVPAHDFGSPSLKQLIVDMFDTMIATDGVGIAAPQIGVNLQVIVFGFEESERYPDEDPVPKTILLNPTITPLSDDKDEMWEGCLSVPGLRGLVPRYTRIRYQGFDPEGNPIDREADGFHARVVQHEHDHLIGRLFPTRIEDMTQFGYTDVIFSDDDEEDEDESE